MGKRGERAGQAKHDRLGTDETSQPEDSNSMLGSSAEDEGLREVLQDLTDEERLVSFLKKVGFSNKKIAKRLGVSIDAIEDLSRAALTKARALRPLLAHKPRSDGGLPLDCPLCGSRLAYQGQKRSRSVYTCDSHGEFHLDTKRGLQHAGRA